MDKLYPQMGQSYYNRPPCAKQSENYYPYNSYQNDYNQANKPQTIPNYEWNDEGLKLPEVVEITNKDLSPASYCSNLDLLMGDFYKNYNLNQWYNSGQKNEFSSCAQTAGPQTTQVKYCSIQKPQEFDWYNTNYQYPQDYYNNCYEGGRDSQFFELPAENLDQQTEESEESDIVVEDTDEEDYNEKFPVPNSKCVICNVSYMPSGIQFYHLTHKNPLTMSTQKPVFHRIFTLVGRIPNTGNYLCSECLGLINTIDHLQLKLENFKSELFTKFRGTASVNKLGALRRKYINPERNYRCKTCRKVISVRKLMQAHVKSHKLKGFLCELCGVISRDKRGFLTHKRRRHRVKASPRIEAFKCSSCEKVFRTKSNRTEHENYCLGLLPYCCKFCDKRFPAPTKLKNHQKLKHDKKFIAICSICNIGFVKYSDYKSHKTSHSTDKKYPCGKCEKSYKTLSNLNFHMKVHNEKLPFICEVCNKGFMRKEYLEAHINNHKGIKNFACGFCEKKFVSQKNLDCHLKYHDGSVKTRTCNLCGKSITTNFEEHLRIHNNLREFECDACDARFNTKGTLAKHKKRKHLQ